MFDMLEDMNPFALMNKKKKGRKKRDKNWLEDEIRIYVPSTNKKDKQVSKKKFNTRVKNTQETFTDKFGGSTTFKGKGTWMGENGLVKENVGIVEVHMDDEAWDDQRNEIFKWLDRKQSKWGQDAVSFEHNNDLTFI